MDDHDCCLSISQQCFRPPLDDYHVIIHLHKEHLPRYEQAVDAMATSSTQQHIRYKHKCTHLPVIDFDPVQKYLQELEVRVPYIELLL